MEISKPGDEYLDTEQLRNDLEAFLNQPGPSAQPPCPNCQQHIPSQCTAECPDVASALSIDPDNHPIEPNMVPMVFELMSTNMLHTSWSCEGHLNSEDELWKSPNVSFYSKSAFYPHLLLKHLANLKHSNRLHYAWQIVLGDYGQTWGVTYCIQPDLSKEQDIHLGKLQMDLRAIADDMFNNLKIIARKILHEINKRHS